MKKLFLSFLFLLSLAPSLQAQDGSTPTPIRKVQSLPATCTAEGAADSSNPVVYRGTTYKCTATNTWTATGTGTGSVSGQANNTIPLATGATAITAQSPLSVSGTTVMASGIVIARKASYTVAGLPTCDSTRVNMTVDVSDGNRAPRTCRNTTGSVYTWVDDSGGIYDIRRFGAVADLQDGTASITSGTNTLTATTAIFASTDVGKVIVVTGAGGGATTNLVTTIAGFTSTTAVTLTANATSTASSKAFIFYTDNAAFGQAAIDAMPVTTGGKLIIPEGRYGFSSALNPGAKPVTIQGHGWRNVVQPLFGDNAQFFAANSIKGSVLYYGASTGSFLSLTTATGRNFRVENLAIIGSGTGSSSIGVEYNNGSTSYNLLHNVFIGNFYYGWKVESTIDSIAKEIALYGNNTGLFIPDTAGGVTTLRIYDVDWEVNATAALIRGGSHIQITRGVVQANTDGIRIYPGTSTMTALHIDNIWWEQNNTALAIDTSVNSINTLTITNTRNSNNPDAVTFTGSNAVARLTLKGNYWAGTTVAIPSWASNVSHENNNFGNFTTASGSTAGILDTSPFVGSNGTASLPTYTFFNNPNSGMYYDGANLAFSFNSSRKFYLNSSTLGLGVFLDTGYNDIKFGDGSPEGAVTGRPGSLYLRGTGAASGSAVYLKNSGTGNTGWAAVLASGDAVSLAATTITSTSANALAIGANGTTNPVLKVNANTASVATGVEIIGAAAGGGVAINAISSGADENFNLAPKGTGRLQAGGVNVPTISSTDTLTNKTVNLTSNTLSGTVAQFNTALSDGDFATLAGSESLTNKKLGSLTSNGIVTTSGGDGTLSVTATTGSGNVVLATSPTLATPTLGVASATSIAVGGGTAITAMLTGSASLDFGATAAGACDVLTITVTGAADGDEVFLGLPHALVNADGYQAFYAWVSGANTVSVKRCNLTNAVTALSDAAAATVKAVVFKH